MMVNRARRTLFGFLGLLALSGSAWSAEAGKVFRAGAYAMDITPPKFPIDVNGSMTPRSAKAAHDPLYARCLVLDDGSTRLGIVVVDSCAVPREVTDSARKQAAAKGAIPADNILISATHAHSCPSVTDAFQSVKDVPYSEFVAQKIAEGLEIAAKQLEPAKIGWAVGQNPHQVFNRRWHMKPGSIDVDPFGRRADKVKMNPAPGSADLLEPAGPIDPDVSIVAVQSKDGRPISVLANYSLHYVGGPPADMVSGDYFGQFALRMAQLLNASQSNPAFVGIMSNGTSGDINNINFKEARKSKPPFEQIRLVADSVAQTAYDAYGRIEFHDWVPLAVRQRELEFAVRKATAEELAWSKDLLAKSKDSPYKKRDEIYAREAIKLAEYPDKVKLIVQAMRIGGLGIASTPCETFVDIGLELKQKSPLKPTFTIELANGYNGYLPTPKHHELGGYETWRARSSYLEKDASVTITATLLELLKEVAAAK